MSVTIRLCRLPKRPARPVATAFIVGLLFASVGAVALTNPATKCDLLVSRQLASGSTSGWTTVILRVDGAATWRHESSLKSLGCRVYRHLPLINSLAVRVPRRSLGRLAGLPFVRHLSADATVRKLDEYTVESSGAGAAWQAFGLTGQGVNVAVLDSGVRSCRDLCAEDTDAQTRIVRSVSFVPGTQATNDACGHGTHVAGIVAGNGAASSAKGCFVTFYGIARSAGIVDVRVLDALGRGTVSSVVAGIQWAIDHRSDCSIRVLNISLGHPVGESYTTDPLCQAAEAAWKAGIVVVCAAGNEGRLRSAQSSGSDNEGWGTAYGTIESPGNDPYVITVGATKRVDGGAGHDRIATYSSRGPTRLDAVLKPDIVAPGNRVVSLMASSSYLATTYAATNMVPLAEYRQVASSGSDQPGASNKYFRLSGTSMAAPVVSGAVALMLQAAPTLTPDTVKARLMISAGRWAPTGGSPDVLATGAGYLDIPGALGCPAVAGGPALSPTILVGADGCLRIDDRSTMCGQQGLWGTGMADAQMVWGTRILWGGDASLSTRLLPMAGISSDRVIWGSLAPGIDLSSIALVGED